MGTKKKTSSRPHSKLSRTPKKQLPSRREVSAGGIVFKRTKRGIVFAMIMDGFGKMTFTKGHVKKGETLKAAAQRESCEEIGICESEVIAKLGTIDIWFVDRFDHKGYLIHKYIHYFLLEVSPQAKIRIPKPSKKGERIKKGVWVSIDKVLEKSDYQDMKPIIKKALKIISED